MTEPGAGPPPDVVDRVAWWAQFAVLQSGLDALRAEAQGVWRLGLSLPHALPTFDALAGSVGAFYAQLDARKCFTCETWFSKQRPPAAIGTLCAEVPDPQNWLVSGVCAACFRRLDIRNVVRHAYETGLNTKIRTIHIGAGGTA